MPKEITLGILGGMGPLATVAFQESLIEHTLVTKDQDHIRTVVINDPSVPDRTSHLLGEPGAASPLEAILRAARDLERMGADFIAMPCVTAHSFFGPLSSKVGVPILNMISLTVEEIASRGHTRAGVLATEGTVKTGIFEHALEAAGITPVNVTPDEQEIITSIIYRDIKRGAPADLGGFFQVCDALAERGAPCIILGCTELPLIRRQARLDGRFIDTIEVLAEACVTLAGKTRRTPAR